MTFKLGTRSEANLISVRQSLVVCVRLAIEISTQDFGVLQPPRTAKEQNALYRAGASQMDGYRRKSNHQLAPDGYCNAVDLTPYVAGKGYDPEDWELAYPVAVAMGEASLRLGLRLRWGGNWYERMDEYPATEEGVREAVQRYKVEHPGPDFIDGPHFEIAV